MKRIYKGILKSNFILRIISILIFLYLRIVYFTSKKSFKYSKNFDKNILNSSVLVAFWHNRLALIPFMSPSNTEVNILHSGHRDGNIIKNIMHCFGFKTISGSSNKDGFKALRQILNKVKENKVIAIVPDGPRGPIYQINGNIIKIAAKTGVPVIPVSYSCTRKKVFNSWDKFILPLPFNNITFFFGDPMKIKNGCTEHEIEKAKLDLKKSLDEITTRYEV